MTKKKSVKRYILWGVLALLTLWLAVMPLMARQQQAEDGPKASILSANATVSSIRTAIHGGGTLEAGDPEDISIPTDVKIEEFLVNNGDFVSEGDPLAAVDKVSVMTAITEIQNSMSTVRKQMESASDEKAATEVSATAGGRVKLVYAKEGDRVESVMLEHGALAVLSLDSKMCVRLTANSPLATGESVTVTLADGKEVTGRVESNLSGELVVTVQDKGYEVGQTVSVENTGTGTLEIHSPWKATAFAGTVSIAYAQPEQTLGAGAALFTLKDTDYTAQRETLAQTHREYEELLQKLFKMYETSVISAPCDGMVSGIDRNSAHLMAAQEEEIVAQPLTAGEGEFRLVLLSGGAICTGNGDCQLENGNPSHNPACPHACDKSENCPATTAHFAGCPHNCTMQAGCKATFHQEGCPEKCTNDDKCLVSDPSKHEPACPRKCIKSDDCKAIHHLKDCIKLCVHANEGQICDAQTHYEDCIKSCTHSQSINTPCSASKHASDCYYADMIYKARVAKVVAVGEELVLMWDASGRQYDVLKSGNGWVLADGQTIDESLLVSKSGPTLPNNGNYKKGDIVFYITGYRLNEAVLTSVVTYRSGPATTMPNFTMPSMNFNFSFSMPSMGGYGGSSSTQTQLYDLVGDVLMTVTPQDTMTLTVPVDESDISSVKTGMLAEITVNALPEEVFEGEITKVAKTGSGNGGSSKFDVEITLDRQGEMLSGMSASAVISLYEKMDVLTLPAAALTEDGGKTVVYTALDKKTGEPINPVEVTTGLSDGEAVEILSGLQSGDSVYYYYYDTLEESDAVEIDRMKMY
ncbi:MAG: HlyD family efflux transporter periplasmic adaptor subunit [Clostridiales bacterium]|nr:HlyD family efflux transporter periplasmic adaptor subunit [Clostridiales bacterium]